MWATDEGWIVGGKKMDERPKPVIGGALPPGSCPGSGELGRSEKGDEIVSAGGA
jgi:hypothetical protein